MSDAQLLAGYNRLEKILKETEVYNRLMTFNKDTPSHSLFDEDEDLLFPVEVGNEMYMKALKVYSETKTLYDGIEKQLNKCIDKINKNEKISTLSNNSKYNINNSNNNNNNSNSNNNNSSSSSDDEEDKKSEVGQKRKSKGNPTPLTSKTKRFKAPSQSDTDRSEKEGSNYKEGSNNTNNNSNGNSINSQTNSSNNSSSNNQTNSNSNASPIPKEGNGSNHITTTGTNSAGKEGSLTIGTLVAAREAKSNQWILAKVNGFNSKTQKYEVIDEDEEEQKKFSVPQKDIIPLPTLSNLPSFTVGTKVLAMFPDTTTFYTAIISQITKNKNKVTHYNLHFDDDQDSSGQTPNRRVSAQHVITYPK